VDGTKLPKPSTPKSPSRSATPIDVPAIAQLKSDLAEALRSNNNLQSRLKSAETEVVRLRTKTKQDTRLLENLNRERTLLNQKTKDRDEELRGKAKFLDVGVYLRWGCLYCSDINLRYRTSKTK
jgi:hypothetical protein